MVKLNKFTMKGRMKKIVNLIKEDENVRYVCFLGMEGIFALFLALISLMF